MAGLHQGHFDGRQTRQRPGRRGQEAQPNSAKVNIQIWVVQNRMVIFYPSPNLLLYHQMY